MPCPEVLDLIVGIMALRRDGRDGREQQDRRMMHHMKDQQSLTKFLEQKRKETMTVGVGGKEREIKSWKENGEGIKSEQKQG